MSMIARARAARLFAVCGSVWGILSVAGWSHPAKAQAELGRPLEDVRVAALLGSDRCWEQLDNAGNPIGSLLTASELRAFIGSKIVVIQPFSQPVIRVGRITDPIYFRAVLCPPNPNVQLSVVGGLNTPAVFGRGKTLTSVDTLNRDNPVLPQSVPSGDSAGVVGGTITVMTDLFGGIGAPVPPLVFETGFLARTEGNATSPVAFPTTVPDAVGTIHDPPKWTVPILAGFAFPIGSRLGLNVTAKVAAGVNVNRREAGFTLRENGAGPAGIPVVASDRWTSVDPALDFGLQVGVGRLGAFPVSVGADVLMDWSRSHTLFAQSPNFRSQSYTMDTGRGMDVLALFNVSLGLAPASAAVQPAIIRK